MGLGGVGGSLGTYLGGCGGDGGGTAVHIRASSTASRATRYGVEVTWGLRGGLTSGGEVVHGRMKGERGAVLAMEAGARAFRRDTSQRQSTTVPMGVGLQTARAPANPPNRIPGTKGWRGRKRPR